MDQISLRGADHEVKMIRHHAMPEELPSALYVGFEETVLKGLMRPAIDKEILPVVPRLIR